MYVDSQPTCANISYVGKRTVSLGLHAPIYMTCLIPHQQRSMHTNRQDRIAWHEVDILIALEVWLPGLYMPFASDKIQPVVSWVNILRQCRII